MSPSPHAASVTLPPTVHDVHVELEPPSQLPSHTQDDTALISGMEERVSEKSVNDEDGAEGVVTPPQREGSSSEGGGAMYATPSPPSSASSGGEFGYGSIPRGRRGAIRGEERKERVDGGGSVSMSMGESALGGLSPIARSRSLRRREANATQPYAESGVLYNDMSEEGEGMWEGRSIVPILPDETTRLMTDGDDHSFSGSEAMVLRSKADLEKARLAANREFSRRGERDRVRYRLILGCSAAIMLFVVFVIVISGITTILANRNYPHLEIFSDWPDRGLIPLKYGCHAQDGSGGISFPLHWRNVPPQATNLAVLFAHPGAIAEQGDDPVHWFVTDIALNDANRDGFILANASANPYLIPEGARMHPNMQSKKGLYWPPCYSNGTSLFVIHVYAIDASPIIEDFKDAREIINRFVGVPVARLMGHYGKQKPLRVSGKKKGMEGHGKSKDASDNDGYHSDEYRGSEVPEVVHH